MSGDLFVNWRFVQKLSPKEQDEFTFRHPRRRQSEAGPESGKRNLLDFYKFLL